MQKEPISIFEFQDYRSYLRTILQSRRNRNRKFSYGLWARKLELKSPSTLIMILQGARHPGPELTEKIISDLNLNLKESDYLRDLVTFSKTKNNDRLKHHLAEKLSRFHTKKFKSMNVDAFRIFSTWLPSAIRELADLRGFEESPQWIQKKLRFKSSTQEIQSALFSLETLGLLSRNKENKLEYNGEVESTFDIPAESIKQFHESIFGLLKDSIRGMEPEEREISGITFSLRRADLPIVKEKIRNLLREVTSLSNREEADLIYHLEIGCLPLTRKEN